MDKPGRISIMAAILYNRVLASERGPLVAIEAAVNLAKKIDEEASKP